MRTCVRERTYRLEQKERGVALLYIELNHGGCLCVVGWGRVSLVVCGGLSNNFLSLIEHWLNLPAVFLLNHTTGNSWTTEHTMSLCGSAVSDTLKKCDVEVKEATYAEPSTEGGIAVERKVTFSISTSFSISLFSPPFS